MIVSEGHRDGKTRVGSLCTHLHYDKHKIWAAWLMRMDRISGHDCNEAVYAGKDGRRHGMQSVLRKAEAFAADEQLRTAQLSLPKPRSLVRMVIDPIRQPLLRVMDISDPDR
jgi:hypothetical protein